MRRLAPLLVLLATACADGHDYAPVAKTTLAGPWSLIMDATEIGEVRFVFDETLLLVYPIDADADDRPIAGWPIDAHVTVDGDAACGPGFACVIYEDGSVPWYLRSVMLVDWSETHLLAAETSSYDPIPLEAEERRDPIALGDRQGDELRAFDVHARFGGIRGETVMSFHFERSD